MKTQKSKYCISYDENYKNIQVEIKKIMVTVLMLCSKTKNNDSDKKKKCNMMIVNKNNYHYINLNRINRTRRNKIST